MKTDLSVQIGSLRLKNPVLTASGTFGYGTEYAPYMDVEKLGGLITKTITLKPRAGNPMPRIAETSAGMLNSIGLANVGVDAFISEKLPELESLKTAVIVNIAGNSSDEYAAVAEKIAGCARVDAIEINVSCPNVKQGGLAFGTDARATEEVVKYVREITKKPLIVKLTPNVTDITETAKAAEQAGADALSLINTVLGMAIDIYTHRPKLARGAGGLSGPAIKPVAIAKVFQTAKAVKIPIIGLGGIMCWQDAVEFMIAGASAIEVGTLNFIEPHGALKIISGITNFFQENNIKKVADIVSSVKMQDV